MTQCGQFFFKESGLNLSHVVYSFCPPGFIRKTVATGKMEAQCSMSERFD